MKVVTGGALEPRPAWALLALLTFLNVLNFVDRQLIPSLAPLIMADLGLNRADIGLLVGFTFVVFYTSVGLALGVAADRWSRRGLIAAGLALWSAMTAVSGAARSLAHLAVPRVLVGIGEATLTPAALSMLGDRFPWRSLGLATAVYYAGLPLGTALSHTVAGWAAPRFGWRACFYALGLAGLAAVALVALAGEPARRGASQGTKRLPPADLVSGLTRALRDRPQLILVMLGGAGLAYASASALHGITWLVQERGFSFPAATYTSGVMALASGLAGNVAGGWTSDAFAKRLRGGRIWSLAFLTVFFAPFTAGFLLLPAGSSLFYACWFMSAASTTAYFGPTFAAIQELAPLHLRSSGVAFGLLVVNMVGVGPGPWVTGMIGDRWSLTLGLLLSLGVSLLAVVPFSLAARREAAAHR
ncbi:MAG: MFS transporter [Vicinamibacterales bacterium]